MGDIFFKVSSLSYFVLVSANAKNMGFEVKKAEKKRTFKS